MSQPADLAVDGLALRRAMAADVPAIQAIQRPTPSGALTELDVLELAR